MNTVNSNTVFLLLQSKAAPNEDPKSRMVCSRVKAMKAIAREEKVTGCSLSEN